MEKIGDISIYRRDSKNPTADLGSAHLKHLEMIVFLRHNILLLTSVIVLNYTNTMRNRFVSRQWI